MFVCLFVCIIDSCCSPYQVWSLNLCSFSSRSANVWTRISLVSGVKIKQNKQSKIIIKKKGENSNLFHHLHTGSVSGHSFILYLGLTWALELTFLSIFLSMCAWTFLYLSVSFFIQLLLHILISQRVSLQLLLWALDIQLFVFTSSLPSLVLVVTPSFFMINTWHISFLLSE